MRRQIAALLAFLSFLAPATPAPGGGTTLDQVRAVPNPCYINAQDEGHQLARELRITNLPAVDCTVRFFNLQGVLIRTIEKTDSSGSCAGWDLKNESGLAVGSGIYVFHVEAKGVGSKVGKLALIKGSGR